MKYGGCLPVTRMLHKRADEVLQILAAAKECGLKFTNLTKSFLNPVASYGVDGIQARV
jgi:hypothetical protein